MLLLELSFSGNLFHVPEENGQKFTTACHGKVVSRKWDIIQPNGFAVTKDLKTFEMKLLDDKSTND